LGPTGRQVARGLLDDLVEDTVRSAGLAATLQNDRVARFEAECGDLNQCVGSGLEDRSDDANRDGLFVQFEVVVESTGFERLAEGIVLSGDTADHLGDGLDFRMRERESVDERLGVLAFFEQCLGLVDVFFLVGIENLVAVGLDCVGNRFERGVPVGFGLLGQFQRGPLGLRYFLFSCWLTHCDHR